MPPRDSKPANSRRKPKLKLDVQEPALTNMLEKYCDLRRRGFGQKAIQTKANWPRHYPSLLLEEAQRREMTGSQGSQKQAVTEWLLAIAAGTGDVLMARPHQHRSARRLTLHLPQRWAWENQFSRALARLRALPLPA